MSVGAETMVVERKRRAPSAEPEQVLLPEDDEPQRRRYTKSLSPEPQPGELIDDDSKKPADVIPDVQLPNQPKDDEPSPLQIVDQDEPETKPSVNKTNFMAYKVQIVQQSERKFHHYGLEYGFPGLYGRKRDTITGRVSVQYIGTAKLFKFVKKSRVQMD